MPALEYENGVQMYTVSQKKTVAYLIFCNSKRHKPIFVIFDTLYINSPSF